MVAIFPVKDENAIVYEFLSKGNTLTKFKALDDLSVRSLPQRIYDLKQDGKIIYDRFIIVLNKGPQRIRVKEYSLIPFI